MEESGQHQDELICAFPPGRWRLWERRFCIAEDDLHSRPKGERVKGKTIALKSVAIYRSPAATPSP